MNASRREVFWRLRLPHALPYLFTAARISVGLALVGATLGETYALVSEGLGWAIARANARREVVVLWANIYAVGLLGALGVALVTLGERLALRWHSSHPTNL